MSWLGSSTDQWSHRSMILIDNSGAAVSPKDTTTVVPKSWEGWSVVNQSDGRDLRVTAADGITVSTFQLTGFSASSRTLTIDTDDTVVGASRLQVLWLYYGSSTATAAGSTFTPSSALTGAIFPSHSRSRIFGYREDPSGAARPPARFQKRAAEELWIGCDFSAALVPALAQWNGHWDYEEVASIKVDVLSGGVSQAAMFDATLTRGIGKATFLAWVKAGTSGTSYTVTWRAITTLDRTLVASCLLTVRDTAEQ